MSGLVKSDARNYCQFNGIILQELLVIVKTNILAAAVVCRLFSVNNFPVGSAIP